MANQVRFNATLEILSGNLKYRSYPNSFQGTITGAKGPCPGALTCSTAGTVVDLTEIATPGFGVIYNEDDTNFVTVGIWDGTEFYPLMEVGPGEIYPLKFSRYLESSLGVGTGTFTGTYRLMVKADTAACNVFVGVFER